LAPHVRSPTAVPRHDCAVWAINVAEFQNAVPARDVKIVSIIDVENIRLRNQDGLFTLNSTSEYSIDRYVERAGGGSRSAITKFVLPVREAKGAIEDMFLMGISPRTVYPGYSGVAEYVIMKSIIGGP